MKPTVAIIGAGYVGMHLAALISKASLEVIAYDKDSRRIEELSKGNDKYREVKDLNALKIHFSSNLQDIAKAQYYIATVPTPINEHHVPDLHPIKSAATSIAEVLKQGDMVILESTVFPGTTEEVMLPILEEKSGLRSGVDFFIGYSPERIVPGDEEHLLSTETKVISGQNEAALEKIRVLYQDLLGMKVHLAPSIKVAEACKLLENIQRDVNIALMNEYTQVMSKMGVAMADVLQASSTKWNFMRFKPGLVGGHCIPVDPYYLIYQANRYHVPSQLISTSRLVNEQFVTFIADKLVRLINAQGIATSKARVAILGMSYKPNVPDIRHSLSIELYQHLKGFQIQVYALDPLLPKDSADLRWADFDNLPACHALVLAQEHQEFIDMGLKALAQKLEPKGAFLDLPGVFGKEEDLGANLQYCRL